ncbi:MULTISPECIES: DUF4145 domain-containing protein [Flavobacteriaceae]|uniref:DUF4145 domain-containing protein n=1 Tax=Flavobacteriaceae TaxID=49546 RepID=UPI000B5CC359|nr:MULTISPECIES: DUF4145 domain-containing protein [Flavobacteriaceae]MBE7649280.1 DUF4145 domain-containing protein [Tenacibaculum finnmarkense genomovar ulcerans]MCG8831479.1 DUF4145 domain-containing protein [Tenacibaculum finnmarkense]SNQ44740.1 conserved hypothetical protein [Cellulophaga lytica]
MPAVQALTFNGGNTNIGFDKDPNECPFCHKSITPRMYQGFQKDKILEVVYRCPDSDCGRIFTALYQKELIRGNTYQYIYKSSSVGTFVTNDFNENIKTLSPNFVDIFNQASKAESMNLNHIAGIGFRKALEFLIKDYLIKNNPDKEENIKKKFLGKCIKDDINNLNVKEMAERATWLGNDETHYVRKWEDKDINDLKILIKVTLHWIEMELLTEQYKTEMQ